MAAINFDNILQSHFKVYSFDVFDTVATRRTATPIGLFMIIQKVLLEKNDCLPKQLTENFTEIRIMAEQEARRITRNEEVTLDEIYGIVAQKFNLSHNIRDSLASLEIDQELQETRPVPQMVHLLNSLYEKNKRIIFTSDTYLPKDAIKKILVTFGVYKADAALYCSSELLITKASGKLFKKILLLEGCSPRDMVHIGDNFHVDILQAGKAGIKTLYYSDTQLSRYENILLYGSRYGPSGHPSNYVWQIIAGASRLVRLNSHIKTTRYRTLSNLGGSIACPIFLIYVIWLLREAKKNNIQRLYFLSRDGQILLEIAKYVNGALGMNIELRYLYASRQALSLPGLSEINKNALSWMMSQDPYCSINIFARRVGLNPAVVQKELQTVAHRRINTNKNLNPQERAHLIGLIKGPLLSSLILNNAKKAKIAAADYFQQAGFFDKIRWGIVDLGWMGHLQSALREILNYAGYAATAIHGFYFGIIKGNIFIENDTNKKDSFFFSEKSPHFVYSTGFQAINFFEIFTTAYHGSVMSYCYGEEDKPCPRFNNMNHYNIKEWGLDHLRSGYQYFLKTIPTDFINDLRLNELFLEEYKRRSCELMKCLMNDPSREEAEALGDYRFSGDQTETVMRRFAPPFSVMEALRFHFLDRCKSMNMTFWWRGTWARSNLINKIFLSSKFKIFAQKMCSMGVKLKN
ncbi:MAG: HAD hydrolase-like protein [Elusimicrobia bacterium]|nr:HAD hydrolase-like protein [Elusimicrobiota bacterium]